MPIGIFLSVGRTSTPQQEEFVSAVEQYIMANGLTPKTVGRSAFSSLQPLKFVAQLMKECAGTVIIAFERTHITYGIERRGSPAAKVIEDAAIPTVWNQIEAAMAYASNHPLLVVVQHGLRSEGLLETGYDWYVQWVPIEVSALDTKEFCDTFADWKRRVKEFHGKKSKKRRRVKHARKQH